MTEDLFVAWQENIQIPGSNLASTEAVRFSSLIWNGWGITRIFVTFMRAAPSLFSADEIGGGG
jgi:hypothetical protein